MGWHQHTRLIHLGTGGVARLLMCQRTPYAMIARSLPMGSHVPACATDRLLHEPRRHAHRVCDLRRRSAACLGRGLAPPPRAGLGQPGQASLALSADAAPHAHSLRHGGAAACPDREGVEFSFEKFVEDLEAVIDAAGLDQFVLFGIAVGATTCISYAVRHPERVSRLVLYAGFVRNKLAGSPTPHEVEETQARLKVMELGWPNDTPAYGQFYTSLHMPDASAEQIQSLADLLRRTTSPANAVALLQAIYRIDVREIAPRIRCPTLVIHSRGNSIVPFEQGRSVAGLIPGARFVPLESRNHILLETEPAWRQFVEAIDEFLPAPAGSGDPLIDDLTAREREVLELVAQGIDNGAIGARLHISERTARNHVSAILAKLGINTRAQAIVRAREAGFGREKVR